MKINQYFVLTLVAITALLQLLLFFKYQYYLDSLSGGLSLLNNRPSGYDLSYTIKLLTSIKEFGINYYTSKYLFVNQVFIVFYAISIVIVNKLIYENISIPIIGYIGLFFMTLFLFSSFVEFYYLTIILKEFPRISGILVFTGNLATIFKHLFNQISLSILFIGILIKVKKSIYP